MTGSKSSSVEGFQILSALLSVVLRFKRMRHSLLTVAISSNFYMVHAKNILTKFNSVVMVVRITFIGMMHLVRSCMMF